MEKIFFVLSLLVVCGCTLAEVNVEILSERTALENQVLGTYNSLDSQMLLAASVRGVDSSGNITQPPSHSQDYKDATSAMQILDFHSDDMDNFKRLGWAGENNQGFIEAFEMEKNKVPEDIKGFAEQYTAEEFNYVISRINESREFIMNRVIYMNENLSDADLPEVKKILGKINAENALPGEKIQLEDGKWKLKR